MKYCQTARAAGLFWSIPLSKSAPELETAASLTGLMVLIISPLTLTICRAVKLNDHEISGQEPWLPLSVQHLKHNHYIINSNDSCNCIWNLQ